MYYVYILKSRLTNKYYIGCTDNIDRRIREHNNGLSKYTKSMRPWILVHSEKFFRLIDARKRERKIKSWKKRAYIEKLFTAPIV